MKYNFITDIIMVKAVHDGQSSQSPGSHDGVLNSSSALQNLKNKQQTHALKN